MAAPNSDPNQEERTEAPTQLRREEFRKQGAVALSREVISVLIIAGGTLAISGSGNHFVEQFRVLGHRFFEFQTIEPLQAAEVVELLSSGIQTWFWVVLPVFSVVMVLSVVGCAAQVGFHLSWEPLSPRWDRLDPIAGVQRIFSINGFVEALKSLAKMLLGACIVYFFLKSAMSGVGDAFRQDVPQIAGLFQSQLVRVVFSLLGAFVVLAAADYGFQRYRLENQMKMSRRELRDEFKLREGDPLIRSRIRNAQRKIAQRRMMDAVPKADVIVTNPTHISVALKYEAEEMTAPKIVAMGADHLAMKIREIAKKHGVPLVENRSLARTLYAELDVGQYIPKNLYKAVAEVLAYVYRLKRAV